MIPQIIPPMLITFLHDLFTVTWLGGLFGLGVIVLPMAKRHLGPSSETKAFMWAMQSRLATWVLVSIVGLALTGALLSRRAASYAGPFSLANPYAAALTIKHVLTLAMVAIAIWRRASVRGAEERAPRSSQRRNARLLYANLGLGTAILLLSAVIAVLGAAPSLPMAA